MASVKIFYSTAAGRLLLKLLLRLGLPKAMAAFCKSRLSKGMAARYQKKYSADTVGNVSYKSFAEYFSAPQPRQADKAERCFLSPCDALLSVYKIDHNSSFFIKGSHYSLGALVGDEDMSSFVGGTALIFRLRPCDYHHFCAVDGGFYHSSVFTEGQLHSVVPLALEHYPVFRLNRRCAMQIDSDCFSRLYQIEIGAMAVGGIVHNAESCRIEQGQEVGRFELCGSTIVILVQPNRLILNEAVLEGTKEGDEYPVFYGRVIGRAPDRASLA